MSTPKPAPPPLQEKVEHPYDRYDLDILVTAYNVQAEIKHTPPVDGECNRETVYTAIESHVKQKRHFDEVLVCAQRQKNIILANASKKWYERMVLPEHEDIYKWQ